MSKTTAAAPAGPALGALRPIAPATGRPVRPSATPGWPSPLPRSTKLLLVAACRQAQSLIRPQLPW